MDKFKKYLGVLKKYHFWAICGTVLVTAIVCWWLATIGLATQFSDRKAKLEEEFKGVVVQPNHPNQGVIDKIREQNNALKRNVYNAWEILYNQQKEKNLLPDMLGKDFKRQFEKLKPKEELEPLYREQYRDFIKLHLPTLLKTIDVRRPAEEKDGAIRTDRKLGPGIPMEPGRLPTGTSGRDAASHEELIGTVDWDASDYRALEERFEWTETPSTLAVVLAQEDLWVIEALLRIIERTNGAATSHSTAAVKRIEAMQIGKDAANAWNDSEEVIFRGGQSTGARGGRGNASIMPPDNHGMTPPSGDLPSLGGSGRATRKMAGSGGTTGARSEQWLMEDRYVDSNGKPVPYNSEYPYAKHPYVEFKMMPISMNLVMDQRRLPKLLVECANSKMPVEVRRIRIMKGKDNSLDMGSAAAEPSAPPRLGGQGGGSGRSTGDTQETGTFDIPVEVQGVIYIYNLPDRKKLGTGTASTDKSTEAAAPAAPITAAPGSPPPASVDAPAALPAKPTNL